MKVIIVGRDTELTEPLAARLTAVGFTVIPVENASSARTALDKYNAQFVVADSALLIDHNLGTELLKRSPLVRLVGFSARPTLPGLIEALTAGLIDCFPRTPDSLEAVTELLVSESRRVDRWRNLLLTGGASIGA
jgi:DNA-binding NtrC family response regulator